MHIAILCYKMKYLPIEHLKDQLSISEKVLVVKNIVFGATITCSKKGPFFLTRCQNPAISKHFNFLNTWRCITLNVVSFLH